VDWDAMLADPDEAPSAALSMAVDSDTLMVTVEVDADFVGWATADNGIDGFGMMYIVDFESYDAASLDVQKVGSCANRNGAMREGDWKDQWVYSAEADRGVDVGTGAYVGNRFWDLSTSEGDCSDVKWTGSFSWYNLLNCTNNDKSSQVIIAETDDWVNMTGAVSVNLVSPLVLDSDSGM